MARWEAGSLEGSRDIRRLNNLHGRSSPQTEAEGFRTDMRKAPQKEENLRADRRPSVLKDLSLESGEPLQQK